MCTGVTHLAGFCQESSPDYTRRVFGLDLSSHEKFRISDRGMGNSQHVLLLRFDSLKPYEFCSIYILTNAMIYFNGVSKDCTSLITVLVGLEQVCTSRFLSPQSILFRLTTFFFEKETGPVSTSIDAYSYLLNFD
jgi:hypothetical protein